MRILVISDMHMEFWKGVNTPILPPSPANSEYDVVVAAGDIGVGVVGFKWLAHGFPDKPIIYVPGNHEYYHQEYHDLNEHMFAESRVWGIHLLNPGTVMMDDYTFIGANLWTDFKLKGYRDMERWDLQGFADFNVIGFNDGKMKHSTMLQIHQLEKQYVESMLLGPNEKTVVITHFVPSQTCIHPKWHNSSMNPYFTNDLDEWFDKYKYPLHIFGHTHDRYDMVHPYGTRLVANPLGYPNENAQPYQWKIVELP